LVNFNLENMTMAEVQYSGCDITYVLGWW